MQHKHLQFGKGFRVVLGNKRSQAAQMTIPSGSSEGGPDNRHRQTDQWLFVVSGKGFAIVGKDRITLRPGSLLLIEHGEPHEIQTTSRAPLKTLSFYVPPGFTSNGDLLPSGRP